MAEEVGAEAKVEELVFGVEAFHGVETVDIALGFRIAHYSVLPARLAIWQFVCLRKSLVCDMAWDTAALDFRESSLQGFG